MTTKCSALEQAPIWLGCLLGMSKGSMTGFTDLYIKNEWLGNPHSFVKISGGRSMTFFACHFTQVGLQAQIREEQQSSQEETEHCATWESYAACGAGDKTVLYCAINTDGPRMTMDLLCEIY